MDDPFAEGREAYDTGVEESHNPYDIDTEFEAHTSWNDGWSEACAQDHQDEDE